MKIVSSLSCLCSGNGELEHENISATKLEKTNSSTDVNSAASSSWKDPQQGASAQDGPAELSDATEGTQEVQVEVFIEEMPKWRLLRVLFRHSIVSFFVLAWLIRTKSSEKFTSSLSFIKFLSRAMQAGIATFALIKMRIRFSVRHVLCVSVVDSDSCCSLRNYLLELSVLIFVL